MIILFIKSKDIIKVSDGLCQKYGYDIRWSIHSVKFKLIQLLGFSVDKLIRSCKKEKELYEQYFTENRRAILAESADV
jgi:hypothetical protein